VLLRIERLTSPSLPPRRRHYCAGNRVRRLPRARARPGEAFPPAEAMLSGPTRAGSISQTSVNSLPQSAQAVTNSNGTGHSREPLHGTGATGCHGKCYELGKCERTLYLTHCASSTGSTAAGAGGSGRSQSLLTDRPLGTRAERPPQEEGLRQTAIPHADRASSQILSRSGHSGTLISWTRDRILPRPSGRQVWKP
jgi:hypothetical protein